MSFPEERPNQTPDPDDFRPGGLIPAYPDPCHHRSQGLRCASCIWWVEKQKAVDRPEQPIRGALGTCRRHAPTISGFPATFETDWCGDHRLSDNA